MGNVMIDLEVAKEYVQANYQGIPCCGTCT